MKGKSDPGLTPMMERCVEAIRAGGGVITRHPGGYWRPGTQPGGIHFGTTTIEALVSRNRLVYDEFRSSHGRQFPIRASLRS